MNRIAAPPPVRRRPTARAITVAAVLAAMLGPLTDPPAATAAGRPPTTAPVVTRAALDPSLVAGEGAQVAFLEQEAENTATNGEIIGPDRNAYTLPSEASGRRAVRLLPGQHVEFVLPVPSRSVPATSTTSSACCSAAPTVPATGSGSPPRPVPTPPER